MPPAACCPRTFPTRRPTARSTRRTAPILIYAVSSDDLPIYKVDDYADTVLAQKISAVTGVVAGAGRRGSRSTRCACRPIPRRWRPRHRARGRAHGDRSATVNQPKGNLESAHQQYDDRHQRPDLRRRGVSRHHRRLPQRRAGPAAGRRPGDRRRRERAHRRAGTTASAPSCCSIFAPAGGQHRRDRRPREGDAAAPPRVGAARRSMSS